MTTARQPEPALAPESLLRLAEELGARGDTAARRTAVDRTYYSVFLYSRDLLAARGSFSPTRTAQDHRTLPVSLSRALGIRAGNDLVRLRRARNQFTYATGPLPSGLAPTEHWLELAADLIATAKAWLAS
jgi:hypothetical protein